MACQSFTSWATLALLLSSRVAGVYEQASKPLHSCYCKRNYYRMLTNPLVTSTSNFSTSLQKSLSSNQATTAPPLCTVTCSLNGDAETLWWATDYNTTYTVATEIVTIRSTNGTNVTSTTLIKGTQPDVEFGWYGGYANGTIQSILPNYTA